MLANPSGPAAVLWDMDGTLVDSEKVWTVSLADTARRLGGALSAEAREAMVGSNMARTLVLMFDDLGLDPDPALVELRDARRKAVTPLIERFRARAGSFGAPLEVADRGFGDRGQRHARATEDRHEGGREPAPVGGEP